MEDIINYEKKKEDDYYFILGCDPSATTEQIQAEFRNLAMKLHPDKNPNDPEAERQFQRLQMAKDVLCEPEKRAKYDKWRESGLAIPFEQWSNASASMTTTLHWASPKTKERMLEASTSDASKVASNDQSTDGKTGMRQQRRSSDFTTGSRRTTEGWESDKSEVLRKFRNYEI